MIKFMLLAAWLVAAWGGYVGAFEEVTSKGPRLGMIVFLVVWTWGLTFALYALLWQVAGKEVITLTPGILSLKRDIAGLGRLRKFDTPLTRDLRVDVHTPDLSTWEGNLQYWAIGGSTIAFEYGERTVRFGCGIEEAEAAELAAGLKSRATFEQ